MGTFDTVWVKCPTCGAKYPAQSKSGPCELAEYEMETAPDDVLMNVNRHAPFQCEKCHGWFIVDFGPGWKPFVKIVNTIKGRND